MEARTLAFNGEETRKQKKHTILLYNLGPRIKNITCSSSSLNLSPSTLQQVFSLSLWENWKWYVPVSAIAWTYSIQVQEYVKVENVFKGILLPDRGGMNIKIKWWFIFLVLFLWNQAWNLPSSTWLHVKSHQPSLYIPFSCVLSHMKSWI